MVAENNVKIALIAAMGLNRVIGIENRLPWDLPADLAYFRQTTRGCPVVMGDVTHFSIGRLLPGRKNIVLTFDPELRIEGATVARSIPDALREARGGDPREVFVIGGASVYQQVLELGLVDAIYLTVVDASPEGDAFFPEFNLEEWRIKLARRRAADKKNPHAMDFLVYERTER